MTLSELLKSGNEKALLIVPTYVQWYDGELFESADVEIIRGRLMINGAAVDIQEIDIGVFEKGIVLYPFP